MLPTTRASFANLTLYPSSILLAALTGAYLAVASLLSFLMFAEVLPVPLWWLFCEWLWGEYLCARIQLASLHGTLILFDDRQIEWQRCRWQLFHTRVLTSRLLVIELKRAHQHYWLAVSRDACSDKDFRLLSLFCRTC
ncbi:hypothetical protein L6J58_06790 [Photobacterium sp. WH80]|nr:hypothetical protein [Photobacterium sp. WH80]